ncbi:hypothetical protein KP509_33G027100 [Ceratopteris richardii]|nr:hypothetical protein KP509_33G027100 [Ceratopteris richardii]
MLYNLRDGGPVIASRSHIVSDRHLVSVDEKWREVRDHIKDASPDGVILVQKLDDEVKDSNGRNSENSLNGSQNTNLWGLLVLGRDITNIACYILKTTCVSSSIGTCTQYCLTKAKCFGASCYDQIQNCWL